MKVEMRSSNNNKTTTTATTTTTTATTTTTTTTNTHSQKVMHNLILTQYLTKSRMEDMQIELSILANDFPIFLFNDGAIIY